MPGARRTLRVRVRSAARLGIRRIRGLESPLRARRRLDLLRRQVFALPPTRLLAAASGRGGLPVLEGVAAIRVRRALIRRALPVTDADRWRLPRRLDEARRGGHSIRGRPAQLRESVVASGHEGRRRWLGAGRARGSGA